MRVPMPQEKYRPKTLLGPSRPPQAMVQSPIPGLSILMPEKDPIALKYQAAADVALDLQNWKAAVATWQNDYITTRTGADARNAEEEARAFNQEQFKPLQKKYAGNPVSAQYLRDQGSVISNNSIGFMHAYAKEENDNFIASVLSEEEKELRGLMTSPWSSEQERKQAFIAYTFKAENWRLGRGESPEDIKIWKDTFSHDLVSEALYARFDRIVSNSPDQALALINLAKGEHVDFGDKDTGSNDAQTAYEQLHNMASEYSRVIPPAQLQLMWNKAEAEQQYRLRLAEEQSRAIHAKVDSTLRRAFEGGDLTPLEAMEGELNALGKTEEAHGVSAMRKIMALAQPYLASSRFTPFAEQWNGIQTFFARSNSPTNTQSIEDETAMGKTLTLAQQGLAQRKNSFIRDPAGYVATHPLLSQEGMSTKEFCQQQGITQEEYITRSLQLQQRVGQGTKSMLRLLPASQAVEIKNQYDALADPKQKAKYLQQLAADSGQYAIPVQAEADIPMGISFFSSILPQLPINETEKLVQAAELASFVGTSLDDIQDSDKANLHLSAEQKAAITQAVNESPLVQGILAAKDMFFGADTPTDSSALTQNILLTLHMFSAMGGNLPILSKAIFLSERSDNPTPDTQSIAPEPGSLLEHAKDNFDDSVEDYLVYNMYMKSANFREMADYAKEILGDLGRIPHYYLPHEMRPISEALHRYLDFGSFSPLKDPVLQDELEAKLGRKIFYRTAEEFASVNAADPTIKWFPGMTINIGNELISDLKEKQQRDARIASNNKLGGWKYKTVGGAAQFTGAAVDPSNLPVIGYAAKAYKGFSIATSFFNGIRAAFFPALATAVTTNVGNAILTEGTGRERSQKEVLNNTLMQTVGGTAVGGTALGGLVSVFKNIVGNVLSRRKAPASLSAHEPKMTEAIKNTTENTYARGSLQKTSRTMGYSPEEFTKFVGNNKKTAIKQYINDFGHHLDLDKTRDYCGAYAESPKGALKNTQATHKPAGELITAVYEHLLKQLPGTNKQNRVIFGGGAGGSVKSTGLFENPSFKIFLDKYHISYDTTLAGSRGLDRIDQALKAGKDIDILFVVRDPLEAIASSFTRAKDTGRFIPLNVMVDMHLSARDNDFKSN